MKVLNNIKAAVTNSLSLAKIKAEEINVSTTEVEITVRTQKEAKKLEKIFSREFPSHDLFVHELVFRKRFH